MVLSCTGFTHILTIDLHSKEIQGFFDVPVDNLRASPFLLDYIRKDVLHSLSSSKTFLH